MTEMDAFDMIGIEGRTSFRREKEGNGIIPAMWERFMKENVSAAIPNRADRNIVALYNDYESDEYGEYTLTIGAKVSSVGEIPAGILIGRDGRVFAVDVRDRDLVPTIEKALSQP